MNTKTFDPTKPIMKVLAVRTKAADPTAEQIDKIKPFLLREFTADELYIRQMHLANDQHDRSEERFDLGYLARFAETITGKSVLVGHDYGTAPVGRFFDADLGKDEQGWQWVKPWFYMPISQGNELARDNIDSGVWAYVSIGCKVDYAGLTCDICGKAYYPYYSDSQESTCPHIAGESYEGKRCTLTWDSKKSNMADVEAVEGSIVYLGCQYEAAIAKDAEYRNEMRETKKQLIEAGIESSKFKGTPLGGKPTAQTTTKEVENQMTIEEMQVKLDAANEEITTLKGQIADLAPNAELGVKMLDDTRAEAKRLAACCGVPEVVTSTWDTIKDATKLMAIKAEYEGKWAEKCQNNPSAKQEAEAEQETKVENPTAQRGYDAF